MVSQKVLQECQLDIFSGLDMLKFDSPLEGQIKVHEEYTKSISDLVCCTSILGGHSSQTGCRYDNADKASHVHAAPGVNFIMEPGAQRIVDDT